MLEGTRNRARAAARSAYIYAVDALTHFDANQVRVVIFAQGRTGSTLLENLLASTGHFRSYGEILSCDTREIARPDAYARGMAKRAKIHNCVFHVKIYQLTRDRRHPIDPAAFLRDLHREGWSIIRLSRRNIVRHALSTLVAEARQDYHRLDDRKEDLKIKIDLQNFERLLAERVKFAREEEDALGDLPRIPISYEDDLADDSRHQVTINRILDDLQLERRPVRAETKKVNIFDPRELVHNFKEVDQLIRARGLDW